MSIKGIFTRGFGNGLGVIKDIVLRGFTPNPEPPKLGDPIDYSRLGANFLEDSVSTYFINDSITASFQGVDICQ